MKKYFIISLLALPFGLSAQTNTPAQTITFDTEGKEYESLGVYDTWEESPFRTGLLSGNAVVTDNPSVDELNATARVLALQRSRFGSNTFGARIDLPEPFELTTKAKYIRVLIHKPTEGRVMLIGLGKRRERAGQSKEAEQFWVLPRTQITTGEWCDAVFSVKGAGGIDIYSLVVVPDLESPHNLTADYLCYIDEIEIDALPDSRTSKEDYPLNFESDATNTHASRFLRGILFNTSSVPVHNSKGNKVYEDKLSLKFQAKAGETVTPKFNYNGQWMSGYVYVDYGKDGKFSYTINEDGTPAEGSDLVAYSFYNNLNSAGRSVPDGNVINPPSFTIPAGTPAGFYRMRYKVDWDDIHPGGNVSSDNHIRNNGGCIVDIRLNVHEDLVTVNNANRNGEVVAADGTTLSDYKTPFGQPLTVLIKPAPGFTHEGLRLRHGYNLAGDSLIHGTPQYEDVVFGPDQFTDNLLTIPAEYVDGDMEIEGLFVKGGSEEPEDGYELVFNDEFNQPDGSQPDPEKWVSSERRNSTWNRYVADDTRVVYIKDGALVCRALRNPDMASDNVPMLTGARETRDKFSFTYGKVLVRLKTTPHKGNFPAAWMLPQPPAEGWPAGGEIDIFETIDAQEHAWHTVHTNWTYTLGNKNNPISSFDEDCTVSNWHVYGLEWTEDRLTWTVDGTVVGTYDKSADENVLAQGQWPFNRPFYLILNQSVGNGSWAAMFDPSFTYETRFDYVRVYQKQGIDGITDIAMRSPENAQVYDLQGRRVAQPTPGRIYIRDGRKLIAR